MSCENAICQKKTEVLVLVPLSHVTLPVRFLNSRTAGTSRSKEPLAGKPKLLSNPSEEYVHWDATPLRSVMWKVTPVSPGSGETVGPCLGASAAASLAHLSGAAVLQSTLPWTIGDVLEDLPCAIPSSPTTPL